MTPIHTHYDNLKVSRGAPIEVIRAAYRALAQKHHPDVNASPDAARVMVLLNEAWRVLSDPELRAKHDAWIKQQEDEDELIDEAIREATQAPPRPSPAAPPRPQSRPARPPRVAPSRQIPRLVRVLDWMGTFEGKAIALFVGIGATLLWLNLYPSLKRAKDAIAAPPKIATAPAHSNPPSTYSPAPPIEPIRPSAATVAPSETPAQSRTPWSPNGKPFPNRASYIPGMPRRAVGGLSSMTIDNANGGASVYVKLCRAGSDPCADVRHVYIPLGSSFKIDQIQAGEYDVRYRNLSNGSLARSEVFRLRQEEGDQGTRYSVMRLTLYTVADGNTSFSQIPEESF